MCTTYKEAKLRRPTDYLSFLAFTGKAEALIWDHKHQMRDDLGKDYLVVMLLTDKSEEMDLAMK